MSINLSIKQQEILFSSECKVIDLRFEYVGYNGAEKYAIVTDLTKEELLAKYPDVILSIYTICSSLNFFTVKLFVITIEMKISFKKEIYEITIFMAVTKMEFLSGLTVNLSLHMKIRFIRQSEKRMNLRWNKCNSEIARKRYL